MNLAQLTSLSESECREYLEKIRWPEGPVCPHCGSKECTKLQGKATRPGVYKCKAKECRKQFTVTVGTIFERSHIALRHWLMAFHLMCASKKGISAHQLHRSVGITYKSAWFMCHRIRHAMSQGNFDPPLSGTIEADETYVGGRRKGTTRGRGGIGVNKTPVLALIERGGRMRAKVIDRVTSANVRQAIEENVDKTKSRLMTDEFRCYTKIGREFEGGHGVVKHHAGEYAKGDITINTAESFFALLKRGIFGAFHHVSREHLHRYCNEFEFRWNQRQVSDSARRDEALRMAEGKRLMYG